MLRIIIHLRKEYILDAEEERLWFEGGNWVHQSHTEVRSVRIYVPELERQGSPESRTEET